MTQDIAISQSQLKLLLELIDRYLPDTEVWAYGSRVKGSSRPSSDLDLVAFTSPEQKNNIAQLREAFEDSILPFRVDLFEWNTIPEEFKKNIKENKVIIHSKSNKK